MRTLSRPPMHLLMTADAVGGVWTYALALARGLAGHGVSTTLAVLGPPPRPDQLAAAAAVPHLAIEVIDAPLDWLADRPRAVTAAASALARLADRIGADVVQLNSAALAAGARFAQPVVAVCHSCVATWWGAVRGANAPMPDDFRWRTRLVAAGLARSDVLVAPTAAFADAVREAYGLAAPPVAVHNGLAAPPAFARNVALASPAPFAFTAGRLWDDGKAIATLDAAAARLSLPVVAAGPVTGPHGHWRRFSSLRLLGELPARDVGPWLANRPLFVATAVYEPFGLAVLEAAAAAAPLVLSDIPTFRELWDGAAVLVPPNDAEALAQALRDLGSDAGLRHAFGLAAARRAERYTIDRLSRRMLGIYEGVLAGVRRQGAGTATHRDEVAA